MLGLNSGLLFSDSGRIEFHEFRAHYNKYKLDNKSKNNKQDILNAFRVFDKNGNGYIEAKELKDILRKLGDNTTDEQIQEMIQVADIDKDGRINYSGKARIFLLVV